MYGYKKHCLLLWDGVWNEPCRKDEYREGALETQYKRRVGEHSSVSEAVSCKFDLFVVSRDLESLVKSKPNVVVLDNTVDMAELETKIKAVFEKRESESEKKEA
jgi:hypothetical protein